VKKSIDKPSKKRGILLRSSNDYDPSSSDQRALSLPSFVVTQALVDLLAEAGGMYQNLNLCHTSLSLLSLGFRVPAIFSETTENFRFNCEDEFS